MLSKVYSAGLLGIDGFIVCCETDVGSGLPQTVLIGYLASEVREAADRVRTAIKNSGYLLSPKKIVINLSPADIKKESCNFDLPIALSILSSYGIIKTEAFNGCIFAGELSLSGKLLSIKGTLSIAIAAKKAGFKKLYVPSANASEGSVIEGIECFGIEDLNSLVSVLNGEKTHPPHAIYNESGYDYETGGDFSDINGQEMLKRATIIAVAGRHNILYIGPAGTGKSMIASRIPAIMPIMSMEERLETSRIYSVCGMLDADEPLLKKRPYRNPHHSISPNALVGGGIKPKPGEISLANHGVLFLDELAEFKRETLEILRQPMEEGRVSISRLMGSYVFPADFMLIAATNPCKCGFYPDRNRCNCNINQIKHYLGKISKPLLDRIDICVETRLLNYDELRKHGSGQKSTEIRKIVENARIIQNERFKNDGILFNSQMDKKLVDRYCTLSKKDEEFLKDIYESRSMSVRSVHKILKVARTSADIDKSEQICRRHICEAISYRSLEEKYWGGIMR